MGGSLHSRASHLTESDVASPFSVKDDRNRRAASDRFIGIYCASNRPPKAIVQRCWAPVSPRCTISKARRWPLDDCA